MAVNATRYGHVQKAFLKVTDCIGGICFGPREYIGKNSKSEIIHLSVFIKSLVVTQRNALESLFCLLLIPTFGTPSSLSEDVTPRGAD